MQAVLECRRVVEEGSHADGAMEHFLRPIRPLGQQLPQSSSALERGFTPLNMRAILDPSRLIFRCGRRRRLPRTTERSAG